MRALTRIYYYMRSINKLRATFGILPIISYICIISPSQFNIFSYYDDKQKVTLSRARG